MSLEWGVTRDETAAPEVQAPDPSDRPDLKRARPTRLTGILLILAATPIFLSALYAVVPPVSTLMLFRWATFRTVERDWVPLEEISPNLPRAVIASEDGGFCRHWGVDWGAVREVIEEASEDWPERGASTVSMQLVKNLYLWQGFGWLRKPIEIVLAHWIELTWSKHRIMEVYLNIAEWGPNGVFGAEAGARRAFGKSAKNLSAREAAIMVAALPNPIIRNPARPTAGQLRRAGQIAGRGADTSCITVPR
ncbi:monofunctional biosynthetic peptidoglycan transglycosylase [Terrihabitans soli]|uniref:Biosynthetic peptidoglycan transglycosylase n=1 Tax=Terrihabitans soli TaxID=708113 RepID=A0A6S6QKD0_9HYPH|nr:monofunctional biosynthetic peptidoglycan transglycosylase [Terrihabitans soli]BCJ89359.1 monofunctional biosynthetic peptidoglycan transglycosylase [Terrihabitans soli]